VHKFIGVCFCVCSVDKSFKFAAQTVKMRKRNAHMGVLYLFTNGFIVNIVNNCFCYANLAGYFSAKSPCFQSADMYINEITSGMS